MIEKAKTKRAYAKLKAREGLPQPSISAADVSASTEPSKGEGIAGNDRQALEHGTPKGKTSTASARSTARPRLLEEDGYQSDSAPALATEKPRAEAPSTNPRPRRRQKENPFKQEQETARRDREIMEARRKDMERATAERARKLEERERHRKAMAKARTGGKNGQRKLGRESKVLLEKVQRIVGET